MKALYTILLLILSNIFMTIAWYGHLKFNEINWFKSLGLPAIILISWGVALFEYSAQVPANRIGFTENGGPFTLLQLKVYTRGNYFNCLHRIYNSFFQERNF